MKQTGFPVLGGPKNKIGANCSFRKWRNFENSKFLAKILPNSGKFRIQNMGGIMPPIFNATNLVGNSEF